MIKTIWHCDYDEFRVSKTRTTLTEGKHKFKDMLEGGRLNSRRSQT